MNRRLALLALFVAATASAETLGRLFFTPAQRAALERRRQAGDSGTPVEEAASVRLDGVLRDSSGRTRIWRNGRSDDAAQPPIKVGETLDVASGARSDLVAEGAVRMERR